MDCSCFTTLTLLFLLPFIHRVHSSPNCKNTQYEWPSGCCDKCPPGQHMISRNPKTCEINCQPCTGKRYTDMYNLESCKICTDCNKENMEFVSQCNSTHNAVCRCKAGFTCEDQACDYCEALPATTAPPATPHNTTVSKPEVGPSGVTTKPVQDTAWFLIVISLLCVGIVLVIVPKIKPLLNWIIINKSYCPVRKPVPVADSVYPMEDEEPCTPVQEMCGKCEQLIEV